MPSLALIFQTVDDADKGRRVGEVSLEAALMAAQWCDFLEAHARKIYSFANRTSVFYAHALAKKIEDGSVEDGATLRSIYRRHWSDLDTPAKVEIALEELQRIGWARSETMKQNVGAPLEVIRLHPNFKRGSDV
jgi:hypothetical protein